MLEIVYVEVVKFTHINRTKYKVSHNTYIYVTLAIYTPIYLFVQVAFISYLTYSQHNRVWLLISRYRTTANNARIYIVSFESQYAISILRNLESIRIAFTFLCFQFSHKLNQTQSHKTAILQHQIIYNTYRFRMSSQIIYKYI